MNGQIVKPIATNPYARQVHIDQPITGVTYKGTMLNLPSTSKISTSAVKNPLRRTIV